jgi:hypothetical protein
MFGARNADEFSHAADVYQELVNEGGANGALWYNLGTARLLADDPVGARDALLRAERHMGTTPEIRRNLERALRAAGGEPEDLPWYRVPLYWHYLLPCTVRAIVLAAAFSGLWIGLALQLLGARRLSRSVAAVSLGVLIVFGSSVASTLYAEAAAERRAALTESVPTSSIGEPNE